MPPPRLERGTSGLEGQRFGGLRLCCWVADGKERRLPDKVSPNRVDFGVPESTGEHDPTNRN